MGSDDALSLFSVTKQDVPLIDEKIQAILDKLPIKRYSCRMELKRLDFCQNVIVPNQKYINENIPNGAKRWKELEKLDVNPVTIKARAGISYLPSLPQLVKLGWLPNLEDTPV